MVIKVLVLGTHQTGSTRLFNLIRLLYENENKNVYSCWDYKNDKDKKYDVIISKVHNCELKYLKNFNIKILPIRNILDAAISANKRWPRISLYDSCVNNILIFNKYKNHSDFIFFYEKYNINYIKKLCNVLNINPSDSKINKIMKDLEIMHNSKKIVKKDDENDITFKKTLFSQSHNTSGGKIGKFKTELCEKELNYLLSKDVIRIFLRRWKYL